jgi:hypothetical protein
MASGDRATIRELMRRRMPLTAPAAAAVAASTAAASSTAVALYRLEGSGTGWQSLALRSAAAMVVTHAEDPGRAAAAASVLAALAVAGGPTATCAGISATALSEAWARPEAGLRCLLLSGNRKDEALPFAVGFAIAALARPLGFATVLDRLLKEPLRDHSPLVKRSGAVWLLCVLVSSLGKRPVARGNPSAVARGNPSAVASSSVPPPPPLVPPLSRRLLLGRGAVGDAAAELAARLPALQRSFLGLLLDRRQSDLGREVAALGLAALAQVEARPNPKP